MTKRPGDQQSLLSCGFVRAAKTPCLPSPRESSRIPVFFKDSGGMSADTLDAPIFACLTKALLATLSPSLEMFSHKTTRTDVCNMFDPTTTEPNDGRDCDVIFHNPIIRNRDKGHGAARGFVDLRDALEAKYGTGRPFAVTLIDPPYTPMEQKKLYSKGNGVALSKEEADDLLLNSHDDINTLYQLSVEWAMQRTRSVIVVYGYKNTNLDRHGWERVAVLLSGAGSGHPTVWGVLYARKEASVDVEGLVAALRQSLAGLNGVKECACSVMASSPIAYARSEQCVASGYLDVDDVWALNEGGMLQTAACLRATATISGRDLVATVHGKQDEYTAARSKVGASKAAPQHPAYLSSLFAALHSALMPGRKLAVVTRQWTVYKEVFKKDAARRRRLFVDGEYGIVRTLFESAGWEDAVFVAVVTNGMAVPPSALNRI